MLTITLVLIFTRAFSILRHCCSSLLDLDNFLLFWPYNGGIGWTRWDRLLGEFLADYGGRHIGTIMV